MKLGPYQLNGKRLFLIAGPCVLEDADMPRRVCEQMKKTCAEIGIDYIFKASFDKANRTSNKGFRGPGLEAGLRQLEGIRREFSVPVLTDVHDCAQCAPVAEVCDVLQIPAFLCRQTDLLFAAAQAAVAKDRVVNVKKGQFLAPWDMKNVVAKMKEFGAEGRLLLTERGASFGYNTLVSDMRSIPIMQKFGVPVVFDATHSVQMPGGQGESSGGQREFAPVLAQAAVAVGVDGLFAETHPNPEAAKSDGPNMIFLRDMPAVLRRLKAIFDLVRQPA
ncbi:MAG: 3-deoxy-8-phosphooctulonate synthase [Planctomycetaceae bacterium]|nr:2-dehydro-3-deoxyphosphooctonate aldolase [Planctomycetota bacterium]MCQ3951592.1 3-deoxy-8-phosphooctulonate synthase [Planctomycetota bacterium]NUO17676.1 3-deoxy-8-phosphooctulonate synthase [Planctomycetaceae bacterium]